MQHVVIIPEEDFKVIRDSVTTACGILSWLTDEEFDDRGRVLQDFRRVADLLNPIRERMWK